MKIDTDILRVAEKEQINLAQRKTLVEPIYSSKKQYHNMLTKQVKQLSKLQRLHYAANQYSLLLIFQAMDSAGKDSTIRHVMSGVNPQGCQVFSFKHPSASELEHDFLWRTNQCLPERGRIGIFNRSYYEEVLVVRVHPEILKGQGLPDSLLEQNTIWQQRYSSIIDLENHLYRNGTRVIKFFLHLSEEEQRKRFLSRIDNPEKNWKFTQSDIDERAFWPEYMHAYEQCLSATSTEQAPWYIIPADDKKNARLMVAQIILDGLASLNMQYPHTDTRRKEELLSIRQQLTAGMK